MGIQKTTSWTSTLLLICSIPIRFLVNTKYLALCVCHTIYCFSLCLLIFLFPNKQGPFIVVFTLRTVLAKNMLELGVCLIGEWIIVIDTNVHGSYTYLWNLWASIQPTSSHILQKHLNHTCGQRQMMKETIWKVEKWENAPLPHFVMI